MTDPSPTPGPVAGPGSAAARTADRVAAAVLDVDGVAALHGGPIGALGTYLPGRRVTGVRLTPDGAEVGVVITYGTPVPALAARIRAVLAPIVGPAVTVTVGDVLGPDDDPPPSPDPVPSSDPTPNTAPTGPVASSVDAAAPSPRET